MAVFQTAGEPPSIGSTSLVTIGWTTNTSEAEVKMATANSSGVRRSTGRTGTADSPVVSLMPAPYAGAVRAHRLTLDRLAAASEGPDLMFPADIESLARRVVEAAVTRGLMIATAESCTGGLVSAALTAVAGSSAVVERGFVTYSNAAKSELLGVPDALIDRQGAVSEPVARAMAEGALARSAAQVSVAVTGIAGPGGGSADKPVGLVHFAAAGPEGLIHVERRFGDIGREAVRLESVRVALDLLLDRIGA